jgi:preprotein translocase subunit SecA/nephrocystin-3
MSQANKTVRVFISSTFRDMHAERDILIKKIFPQLRKLREERAVSWTDVDLRWGITDEETAEGKVLPLCLAEIERSRSQG